MHRLLLSVCAILTLHAGAGEVLLHSGPTVSTPVSSLASDAIDTEELTFQKLFYIDSEILAKLPLAVPPPESPPISAERAAQLAARGVDPDGSSRDFKIERTELLAAKQIEFYLVEMTMNGSTEHRIVLMDGSLLKPRLKRITRAPNFSPPPR